MIKFIIVLALTFITGQSKTINTYQNPLGLAGKALRDASQTTVQIPNQLNYFNYQSLFLVSASCQCETIIDEPTCLPPFCYWQKGACTNSKFKSENSENFFNNFSKILDFESNLNIVTESQIIKATQCGTISASTKDCIPKIINNSGQYQLCSVPKTPYTLNTYDNKPKSIQNSIQCEATSLTIQQCSDITDQSICLGPCVWTTKCVPFTSCNILPVKSVNTAFNQCWRTYTDSENNIHQCIYNSFTNQCSEMSQSPTCNYFRNKSECVENLFFNKENNWLVCYWSNKSGMCLDCTGFLYSGNF